MGGQLEGSTGIRHSTQRSEEMKALLLKGMLTAAVTVLALAGSARAQDNDGCTNATLNGDYASTISGHIFIPNGPTIQREGIDLVHFDGAGHFTQVDFVLSSPNAGPPPGVSPTDPTSGFHNEETGSYTVNADCTGHFEIDFPSITMPAGTMIKGAVIQAKFVLSNHGRTIHAIVTSLTPPGAPGPVPALIRSEGYKLGKPEAD
jgi:hypothetical protein